MDFCTVELLAVCRGMESKFSTGRTLECAYEIQGKEEKEMVAHGAGCAYVR